MHHTSLRKSPQGFGEKPTRVFPVSCTVNKLETLRQEYEPEGEYELLATWGFQSEM